MIINCPICNRDEHGMVWRSDSPFLPIARRRSDGYAALFSTIKIAVCHYCGCGFNRAFDSSIGAKLYGDVALTNMPVDPSMHARLNELAAQLPLDAIHGRHVLEIGAGGGHFSRLLASKAKEVTLLEPCRQLTREMVPESNIEIVHDVFPAKTRPAKAHLVVARQVLEHVADPSSFMEALAGALTDDGYAFIEMPNARYIEQHGALFDLHVQHVQYFYPEHLKELGRRAGLIPLKCSFIKDGHDFGILFRRGATPKTSYLSAGIGIERAARWKTVLERRISELHNFETMTLGRVALYGATMHGTVFLNLLEQSRKSVDAIVDDNQGYTGYGLYTRDKFFKISTPSADSLESIDSVIISAYLHDAAIGNKVRALGFDGAVFTTNVASRVSELLRVFAPVQSNAKST